MSLLLGAGADKDFSLMVTALLSVCCSGHVDVVRLLLGAAADSDLQGNRGREAFAAAYAQGHGEIVRLLLPILKECNPRTAF